LPRQQQEWNAALVVGSTIAEAARGVSLPPMARGEISLAQHELLGDMLGADVADRAAQHVVSAQERARRVVGVVRDPRSIRSPSSVVVSASGLQA